MNMTSRKWTGVAEVAPQPGNGLLNAAAGAYVGVVGLVDSEADFRAKTEAALQAMGFNVLEVSDVMLVESEEQLQAMDARLIEGLKSLSFANPIELGSFHAYT